MTALPDLRTTLIRAIAAAAGSLLLAAGLTGCGGSSSGSGSSSAASPSAFSARDTTAAKNISGSIVSSQKTGGSQVFTVTKDDADCIGRGLVSKVGTNKLVSYGVLAKDLTAKASVTASTNFSSTDAASATDVFFSCADIVALVRTAVTKSGTIPANLRSCVDKALSTSTLRPYLEQSLEGKQATAQKQITAALSKCAGTSGG